MNVNPQFPYKWPLLTHTGQAQASPRWGKCTVGLRRTWVFSRLRWASTQVLYGWAARTECRNCTHTYPVMGRVASGNPQPGLCVHEWATLSKGLFRIRREDRTLRVAGLRHAKKHEVQGTDGGPRVEGRASSVSTVLGFLALTQRSTGRRNKPTRQLPQRWGEASTCIVFNVYFHVTSKRHANPCRDPAWKRTSPSMPFCSILSFELLFIFYYFF